MPARRIYFRVTMGIGTEIGRLKLQKKIISTLCIIDYVLPSVL